MSSLSARPSSGYAPAPAGYAPAPAGYGSAPAGYGPAPGYAPAPAPGYAPAPAFAPAPTYLPPPTSSSSSSSSSASVSRQPSQVPTIASSASIALQPTATSTSKQQVKKSGSTSGKPDKTPVLADPFYDIQWEKETANDRLEMERAFKLFDSDNSNSIEPKEMKAAMLSLGFDVNSPAVNTLLSELDKDKSGSVDLDEFIAALSGKNTNLKFPDVAKIFMLFDQDRTGMVSFTNLKNAVKELGEEKNVIEVHLREMMKRADLDQDGEISPEEFYLLMTQRSYA